MSGISTCTTKYHGEKNIPKKKKKNLKIDLHKYMHFLTTEPPRLCFMGCHILLGTLIGESVLQTTTKTASTPS